MVDENKVIESIRRRNQPNTEVHISRTIPSFLDGDLVVVDLFMNEKKIGENFYYSSRSSNKHRSFTSMDELALWMGQQKSLTSRPGKLSSLSDFRIVSGIIALLITVTIVSVVFAAIFTGKSYSVPEILANALTTILGFYFGSQVAKTRSIEEKRMN